MAPTRESAAILLTATLKRNEASLLITSLATLSAKWWTFLLRGILALCLAAFAFVAPANATTILVYLFAIYFICNGVGALFAGISNTGGGASWTFAIMGILQIGIGIIVLAEPVSGALSLALLFAIWLVVTGVLEISSAISLREYVANEFWSIALGVVTLCVGFFLAVHPGLSLLSLVLTMGVYALLSGIALIGFAFRMKSIEGGVKVSAVA